MIDVKRETHTPSRPTSDWRRKVTVAFGLTVVMPLLTLGYFLATYVWPNSATVENITVVVMCNIALAACGFAVLFQELRKQTAQLTRKMSEFTSFINALPDMAWLRDANSKFIVANKAFCAAMRMDASRLVNRGCEVCFGEEAASKKAAADRQVMESKERMVIQETMETADGRTLCLETIKAPVFDAAGIVIGTVGIARDMTEHMRKERELRQSNIQLSDALEKLKSIQQKMIERERLNALGEMASGIAHDFNNLLMPIVGFSQLLLEEPDIARDKEDFLATVRAVHTAGVDAKRTVHRLREFYRSSVESEYVPVDLSQVIQSAIVLTRPKWQEEMNAQGVRIDVQTRAEAVPLIYGNEAELRDAAINLILNSVDAMRKGGTLLVSVRREGDKVLLEVKDTGVGMSRKVQSRCFEPFFTTKGVRGTGLGLSTVYGIIERHSGTIEIDSEEGKGTTIRIRLPQMGPVPAKPQDAKGAGPLDIPLHVLIIDDAVESRYLVSRFLKADKHTVDIAKSGTEGLVAFQRGVFDLVITDRAMSDMSGDDVAYAIKKSRPGVPVIMLTGFGDIMKENVEKPAGVDLILGKPATREELREGIWKVTGRLAGRTQDGAQGSTSIPGACDDERQTAKPVKEMTT